MPRGNGEIRYRQNEQKPPPRMGFACVRWRKKEMGFTNLACLGELFRLVRDALQPGRLSRDENGNGIIGLKYFFPRAEFLQPSRLECGVTPAFSCFLRTTFAL